MNDKATDIGAPLAEFELRRPSCEVVRQGVPQVVDAVTFDVLDYLIANRHRVVSKKELLEHLKPLHGVAQATLRRCVVTARKAIGDDVSRPFLIKTIPRIGYRFMGQLLAQPRPAGGDVRKGDVREVAWLPCQNATAMAELAWASLGLMAVATAELAGSGIVPVPTRRVMEAFDPDDSVTSYEAQARKAFEASGITVVASTLSTRNDGNFDLAVTVWCAGRCWQHEFTGPLPTDLAIRAARTVVAQLTGEADAAEQVRQDNESFYDRVAARARVAVGNQHFAKAHPLLAICVDSHECSIEMAAAYTWVLAVRSEAALFEQAGRLVEQARTEGRPAYEGWAYACLMLWHLHDGDVDLARSYGAMGLSIVRDGSHPPMLAQALVVRAELEAAVGDCAAASLCLEEAGRLESQFGDPALRAWVQQVRGLVALLQGNTGGARRMLAEALATAQAAQSHLQLAWSHAYMGACVLAAGQFQLARHHFQCSTQEADRTGQPRAQVFANLRLGLHCVRLGDLNRARACADRLNARVFAQTRIARGAGRRLHGAILVAEGHPEIGVRSLLESMELLSGFPEWWTDGCWTATAQAALAADDRLAAKRVLDHLEARPNFQHSNVLLSASLVLRGMLAYFDGDERAALEAFRRARGFGVQGHLGAVIRCALSWLAGPGGSGPAEDLQDMGDWLERTVEGKVLRTRRARGLHTAGASEPEPTWSFPRRLLPMPA
jgi:tetratricopeptide (TPR) repeat protein